MRVVDGNGLTASAGTTASIASLGPAGSYIVTPYDSLSFVPTILTLLGKPEPQLPGPVIRELVPK